MASYKRTNCSSVSYTPTSWLPVQRLSQVFPLPAWFIVFLPSLSRSIPPYKYSRDKPMDFLLLDHDFVMDHSLALEIVPMSVHTSSWFRSLAQRNGHLIPEGLLPGLQINLCRAQVNNEVCKHLELTGDKRSKRGKGQIMFVESFFFQWRVTPPLCCMPACSLPVCERADWNFNAESIPGGCFANSFWGSGLQFLPVCSS